jgi:hypothetical protein
MKRRLDNKSKRVKNVRITRKNHRGGNVIQPNKKESYKWYEDDAVMDQIDPLRIGKLMDYIWEKVIQRRVKPVQHVPPVTHEFSIKKT